MISSSVLSAASANVSYVNRGNNSFRSANAGEKAQNSVKVSEDKKDKPEKEKKTKDTVEISAKTTAGSSFSVDVDSLIEQNNQRIQSFTSKLMSMVSKKGKTANAEVFGLKLNVTQQDINEAKASISEGGEWSVTAVSDRIMNMAYALSGGDESKLATLKDAVLKGFSEAGFDPSDRSSMPEITGQTYDEILNRFDDWEKNGIHPYGMDSQKNTGLSAADTSAKRTSVINIEA